jgi:hypothetical protein
MIMQPKISEIPNKLSKMITAVLLRLLSKLLIILENSGLYKPSYLNFTYKFSITNYRQHQQSIPSEMTTYLFNNNFEKSLTN